MIIEEEVEMTNDPPASVALQKDNLDFELSKFTLLEMIETAKNDLEAYAKRETSSEFYIKKRSAEINQLIEIFNFLEGWKYYLRWEILEVEIAKFEKEDNSVDGYNIFLTVRKGNGYYSFIQL